MNSIKAQNKIDTVFMNSENGKTSDSPRLLLNLSEKIDLKGSDKHVALSNIKIYYTLESIKKSCKNNEFKISDPTQPGIINLNYLTDRILYQIFKIFWI